MTDIKSMLLSELQEDFALRGLQKFRAAQVYRWLHQRGATSFDEMTDLSKDLRVALKESFEIRNTEIAIRRVSKIDGTKKYLFRLNDGEMIESVLMKYKHGYSICISTQVGCKMGCTFCATGKSGFSRDLLPSEMISEIQTAQKDIGEAKDYCRYMTRRYRADEPSSWGIVDKKTGRLVGTIGYMNYDMDNASVEIGYSLAKWMWNGGYMTEALRRVIDYTFDAMDINRIEAQHELDNPASGRVMEKCGMRKEGVLRQRLYNKGKFVDVALYAILKDDARPARRAPAR